MSTTAMETAKADRNPNHHHSSLRKEYSWMLGSHFNMLDATHTSQDECVVIGKNGLDRLLYVRQVVRIVGHVTHCRGRTGA